jgi:hypothetical protein
MEDEMAAPARKARPRWLLPALLVPIGILVVANTSAGILSATLVERHPALLITLSSQNRWLILVSNKLDAVTFYGIGFLRLVVADPLFYFLGLFYGDAALRWLRTRSSTSSASSTATLRFGGSSGRWARAPPPSSGWRRPSTRHASRWWSSRRTT